MYALAVKPDVDKTFAKLVKKDRKQLLAIGKKIEEIRANPHHVYKFLRKPLQRYNRVHIDSNFVLIFRIDHNEQMVTVYAYDHHDAIYKWRPASD